jgi:hypothetical protein
LKPAPQKSPPTTEPSTKGPSTKGPGSIRQLSRGATGRALGQADRRAAERALEARQRLPLRCQFLALRTRPAVQLLDALAEARHQLTPPCRAIVEALDHLQQIGREQIAPKRISRDGHLAGFVASSRRVGVRRGERTTLTRGIRGVAGNRLLASLRRGRRRPPALSRTRAAAAQQRQADAENEARHGADDQ